MYANLEINFYKWSRDYFQNEIKEDFPVLRQFEIVSVQWFIQLVSHLDAKKKNLLAKGLLKRATHSGVATLLNEPTNPAETEMIEWYLKTGRRAFETGEWLRLRQNVTGKPMPRGDIRRHLLAFMGNKLGNRTPCDAPGCVTFDSIVDQMIVRTYVCLNGRIGELTYYQELLTTDKLRIMTFISILSWLGISGSTVWERVTERNLERSLKALFIGCSEFLSAVPKITVG